MQYRIFPSIGIARIGDSDEVFVGPEVIGSRGRELDGSEVKKFKDAKYRVRKQAARFHVFQREDASSPWTPLPADVGIEWTVEVANKKDAIKRFADPPDPNPDFEQPILEIKVAEDAARTDRLIRAKDSIQSNAGGAASKILKGTHVKKAVKLGELRVDAGGRLLFLGGDIDSAADPKDSLIGVDANGKEQFYNNPGWHDDVADGPVSAKITLPDKSTVQADAAWVIVAPPDFAPGAEPIVTLFDVILQMALGAKLPGGSWTVVPDTPSFTRDIYPIIRRARSLGWVHVDVARLPGSVTNQKNWATIDDDYRKLNDRTPENEAENKALRSANRDRIMLVQPPRKLLSNFKVPRRIKEFLDKWVEGNFKDDWGGVPAVAKDPTAESLTRAALEGAVGQGFFPGIEAGRILVDPRVYSKPFDFRIDRSVLSSGDATALMAQPWQADFLKCMNKWWPSQRPDIARQADGSYLLWHRPLKRNSDHKRMVEFVKRFGMITVQVDEDGKQVSAIEEDRDPKLPKV